MGGQKMHSREWIRIRASMSRQRGNEESSVLTALKRCAAAMVEPHQFVVLRPSSLSVSEKRKIINPQRDAAEAVIGPNILLCDARFYTEL